MTKIIVSKTFIFIFAVCRPSTSSNVPSNDKTEKRSFKRSQVENLENVFFCCDHSVKGCSHSVHLILIQSPPPTAFAVCKEAAACGSWYQGCVWGGVEVGGAASQPPATLWIRVDPFFSPWPSFVYGVSALFKWWHRGCRDWLLMELLLISTVTSVQLHCCAEVFVLGLNGRVDGCSAVCGVESFLKWKVFRYLGELWLKSSFQRWTTSSFTPVQRPLNFRLWPPWVTKKETYSEGKIKLLFNLVNLLLNVATMHDTKSWEICTLSKTSQTHSDENCISSVFNVLVAFFDDRGHIKKIK